METMIPPQVGMSLQNLKNIGQRSPNKKKRPKRHTKKTKKKRKRVTTLVLQSSTMIFMIESLLCCHFHILVGIFHCRTWLVYSNNGLPQVPQVFVSKQVGCTPTQFLLLSFHTLIALVHLLHSNPYSLTLICINGHLHSPLIRLVDVRLSPSFCLLHNQHLYHLQCYVHGSRSCIV